MAATRWTVRHYALLMFATVVIAYAANAVYRGWQAGARHRQSAAREERRRALHSRMWEARDRLQNDGARIPVNKMCLPFQFIDLSGWTPGRSGLSDLSAFAALPQVRPYENTLSIRLGPAVGSDAASVLCGLRNIERLDINGAGLSTAEIDEIMRSNSQCRLGVFDVPEF